MKIRPSLFVWLSCMLLGGGLPGLAKAQSGPVFQGFTPSACVRASKFTDHESVWVFRDTAAFTPERDTTSQLVADSMSVCAQRFAGHVPPAQLLDAARVEYLRNRPGQARALQEQYLATLRDSTVAKRAWALSLIARDRISLHPPRVAEAREALQALDAFGPEAAKARFFAHAALADTARSLLDDTLAEHEMNAAVAAWRECPPPVQRAFSDKLRDLFLQKAELLSRLRDAATTNAFMDSAMALMPMGKMKGYVAAFQRMYRVAGRQAKPIEARFWFDTPDGAPGPRPTPGKVTFVSTTEPNCENSCSPRYRALTRYLQRFAAQGLDIVNLTQTRGFYADTAPMPSEAEARHVSQELLDRRKLPGMLGVYETKYEWRDDGVRLDEDTPQQKEYEFASMVLVDRHGKIRYVFRNIVGDWDPRLEVPLAVFIQKLLAE